MIRRPTNDTRSLENREPVSPKYGKPLLAMVLGILHSKGCVVRQYDEVGIGYYTPSGVSRKDQKYVIYKMDTSAYRKDNVEESFQVLIDFETSFTIEGISREESSSSENTYIVARKLIEWMIKEDPSISDSVDEYMWYLVGLIKDV